MNVILSEKGQVTIPKSIRDGLGLVPGSILDFTEEQGRIIVNKVVAKNPFSAWRGKCQLPCGNSVEEYLEITRGDE